MSAGRSLLVAGVAWVLSAAPQSPSASPLILNKADATLAIVDPATFEIRARIPTGERPEGCGWRAGLKYPGARWILVSVQPVKEIP